MPDQMNTHPNPLSKPNSLTTEGLALSVQRIETNMDWVINRLSKLESKIDKIDEMLSHLNDGISEKAKEIVADKTKPLEKETENLHNEIKAIKKNIEKQDSKIQNLERSTWYNKGKLAVLSSVIGGLSGVVAAIMLKLLLGL